MGRVLVELDEDLVARVMAGHGFATQDAAIHHALSRLVADPPAREGAPTLAALTRAEALAMRGSGWEAGAAGRDRRPPSPA